ncbi:serine protease Do [Nitrosospira sp. Nsp5]|uniref:Probable periplasmic serine endoprotease DegP-like n=1 Tax=Nitrosospira multiformis TaxID=1231 RepID=A0ABY0TCX4_9PROT|nr:MULTISPECIES: DegQ family serine endoprotease [Nitrosospira]PTR05205.1 serine protease Do [Nitrosospira sp. Nsp5]SCY59909.1 serine protease Do [Nitrosospira sp. Nsp13]SDQ63983.1 serine protease Do [Nitrosospira multiformis]
MIVKYILVALFGFSTAVSAQTRELPDFTGLVEKEGASVVNISTVQAPSMAGNRAYPGMPNIPEDDPFFEFFRRYMPPHSAPRDFESKSLGSGFIITSDGYILTNTHLVDSAEEITVKLTDKREFRAKLIGADRKTDIALLKIDAAGLPKVTQGDPNKLKVGEWVVAIGSPFGFENSVTAGIVSAKGRSLAQENFVPFIQTDVAINPGNSGGPLFNMKGEVVGINSQIYSRTGGFMGLSFAIPIDVATDISNQLIAHGKVSRGRIGVLIQEVTKELAESFGLPKPNGALVASVQKDGPADKAGIEARDVILKFDGKPVNASGDLPRIVGSTKPGSKVQVQVWRNGSTKELTVAVDEVAPEERVAGRGGKRGKPSDAANRIGLALSELTAEQKQQLDIENGLLVEDMLPGIASRAGVRPGDVILSINNQDVKTVEQFNQLLNKVEKGRNIAILVRRGDTATFITMKLNGDNK